VLLIHGDDDRNVPFQRMKFFDCKLTASGERK